VRNQAERCNVHPRLGGVSKTKLAVDGRNNVHLGGSRAWSGYLATPWALLDRP
jgi:hypothetical protein